MLYCSQHLCISNPNTAASCPPEIPAVLWEKKNLRNNAKEEDNRGKDSAYRWSWKGKERQ